MMLEIKKNIVDPDLKEWLLPASIIIINNNLNIALSFINTNSAKIL